MIREERVRQGLSQEALAEKIGIKREIMSQIETGTRPYWTRLQQVVEYLAPRAGKTWLTYTTKLLMGKVDEMVWSEPDPVKRLLLAARITSSGDRATVL